VIAKIIKVYIFYKKFPDQFLYFYPRRSDFSYHWCLSFYFIPTNVLAQNKLAIKITNQALQQ